MKTVILYSLAFACWLCGGQTVLEKNVSNKSADPDGGIPIRVLDVPAIYEIRDKEKVSQHVDLNSYSNDVLMCKLLPRSIAVGIAAPAGASSAKLELKDPFSEYDIHDVFINGMSTDDIAETLRRAEIEVIVNQQVYDELDAIKDETFFNWEYVRQSKIEYLKDLAALPVQSRRDWIKIMKENRVCSIEYVPNAKMLKILAEVRYEKTFDVGVYIGNLETAQALGYTGILFRFDTTEDIARYKEIIALAKSRGFSVFLTYVGLDNQVPRWNPFADPAKIQRFLKELCPLAHGMFLNWRSTSSHVKLLPIEFFNYMCNSARAYNRNLMIFGEVFYGKIDYLNGKRRMVFTCPQNVSGILINNMGYYGYNHTFIINKLFADKIPNYRTMHKVGQVIGYRPYYCSKQDAGLDDVQERKFKKHVEKSFNSCNASTVTFLHDGVDDNFVIEGKYNTNDNVLTDKRFSKDKKQMEQIQK